MRKCRSFRSLVFVPLVAITVVPAGRSGVSPGPTEGVTVDSAGNRVSGSSGGATLGGGRYVAFDSHAWTFLWRYALAFTALVIGLLLLVACGGGPSIEPGADLNRRDLSGRDLSGRELGEANLDYADLTGANLTGADLAGAHLTSVVLAGANLSNADMSNANLRWADLTGADLSGANLSHANLNDVKFGSADLTGANLSGASLDRAQLRNAVGVTDDMLDSAASLVRIELDSEEEIAAALKPVCGAGGVEQAAVYTPGPGLHPIVLLASAGEPLSSVTWMKFTAALPEDWLPPSVHFVELVACVEESREAIETCAYIGPSVTRYQYYLKIKLMAAQTGQTVASGKLRGDPPYECPPSVPYSQTEIGVPVTEDALVDWLRPFVAP